MVGSFVLQCGVSLSLMGAEQAITWRDGTVSLIQSLVGDIQTASYRLVDTIKEEQAPMELTAVQLEQDHMTPRRKRCIVVNECPRKLAYIVGEISLTTHVVIASLIATMHTWFAYHVYHRMIPTSSIPNLPIPTLSISHFVNSHLVNVDKVGIDKVGS